MKTPVRLFAATVSATFFAACGGNTIATTPPSALSQQPQTNQTAPASSNAKPTLYVSEDGGLAIYAAGGALLLRKIRAKSGPIATDSKGNLYAAGETATAVNVYENRGAKLAWKVHTKPGDPRRLALDHSGDLYENCGDSNLCEYGPHNKGLVRQIRGHGSSVALDTAGNLYLAAGFNYIAIYARGQTAPERTITNGISGPEAIAVDLQGNLYVANAYLGSQPSPNVTVYAPGGSSPMRTIANGITIPYAMTTDSAGSLYVLNSCVNRGGCTNDQDSVAIYGPGSDTPQQVVSDGFDFPVTLAVDATDDLFVANVGNPPNDRGSITVYAAGSYSLSRTITHAINHPFFLALGP